MRDFVSRYTLDQGYVPMNPFKVFDYFLLHHADDKRDAIMQANNTLVKTANELWSFGPIADGVFAEILIAAQEGKPIRLFRFEKSKHIIPVTLEEIRNNPDILPLEPKVADRRDELLRALGIS